MQIPVEAKKNKSRTQEWIMKVIILGSSAGGVPQIDCMECRSCRAAINHGGKNRRTMTSIAIENRKGFTLIDADPDLRFQMEREGMKMEDINGIFITHAHGDHMFGLFNLSTGRPHEIPIYSKKKVLDKIFGKSFAYLEYLGYARPIPIKVSVEFHGHTYVPFEVPHTRPGDGPTLGYCVKEGGKILNFVPDISKLTPDVLKSIDNSDVLIIDGVFYDEPRAGHAAIVQSIPLLQKLDIGEVIFTQMNHTEPTHEELEKLVKPYGFKIAYDGMKIKL
jgi:phosphoribosyl 1,2-cyclic phosphate phosphodiesterase